MVKSAASRSEMTKALSMSPPMVKPAMLASLRQAKILSQSPTSRREPLSPLLALTTSASRIFRLLPGHPRVVMLPTIHFSRPSRALISSSMVEPIVQLLLTLSCLNLLIVEPPILASMLAVVGLSSAWSCARCTYFNHHLVATFLTSKLRMFASALTSGSTFCPRTFSLSEDTRFQRALMAGRSKPTARSLVLTDKSLFARCSTPQSYFWSGLKPALLLIAARVLKFVMITTLSFLLFAITLNLTHSCAGISDLGIEISKT